MVLNCILLSISAFLWGMGFIATKWILEDYSPFWANTLRFGLASLIALPFLIFKKSWRLGTKRLNESFLGGLILFVAMLLQTYGLTQTTVAKSGFLTTFYAFFTPLLGVFLYEKKFMWGYWPLMSLGIFGIALLCDLDFGNFNWGDALTLACAFLFAVHIIFLSKIVHDFKSSIELNLLQCFWLGLVSVPVALLFEGVPDWSLLWAHGEQFSTSALWGLILLSFFSSMVAFSIQVHSQRTIPAHIVGLIFLLESPFAAVLGYYFLNESLSALGMLGCGLVLVAVVLVPRYGKELPNLSSPMEL